MSAESRLLEAAKQAAGDDTIIDVAVFHPKGWAGSMGTGAAAGDLLGGSSVLGSAIGALAGGAAGAAAAGGPTGLPQSVCIAITPEQVHLMEHRGATDFSGDLGPPFATLDRSALGVEVHQRALNRVVVLHDGATDAAFSFEAPRFGPYHAKALVQLLMMAPEHVAGDPSP